MFIIFREQVDIQEAIDNQKLFFCIKQFMMLFSFSCLILC